MDQSTGYFMGGNDPIILSSGEAEQLIAQLERANRPLLWIELPALVKKMESISRDSTCNYPHVEEVLVHLILLRSTLLDHMEAEEVSLFYPIKNGEKGGTGSFLPSGKDLKEIICAMENEHALVKEGFSKIRFLCQNYQLPLKDAVLPDLYARLQKCENLFLDQVNMEHELLFNRILLGQKRPGG